MRPQPNIDLLIDQLNRGAADDPDAEWKAAIALGDLQLPPERQRAATALIDMLRSGRAHALIRAHAVEALGKLSDTRAIPALLVALEDPYRLVRAYSLKSLANLNPGIENLALILRLFESDEFFGVRAEAAHTLTNLAASQNNPTVLQQVRETLVQRREPELNSPEPGSDRVAAEIDRCLAVLS